MMQVMSIINSTAIVCNTTIGSGQTLKFDNNLIHSLNNYFLDNETLSVSEFKDITGLTRKNAIPILEYLDNCNYTIRNGS